jgi:hypothetical protein
VACGIYGRGEPFVDFVAKRDSGYKHVPVKESNFCHKLLWLRRNTLA